MQTDNLFKILDDVQDMKPKEVIQLAKQQRLTIRRRILQYAIRTYEFNKVPTELKAEFIYVDDLVKEKGE